MMLYVHFTSKFQVAVANTGKDDGRKHHNPTFDITLATIKVSPSTISLNLKNRCDSEDYCVKWWSWRH